MVKYSIIIPCYNAARFINNCFEGISGLYFDRKFFEVLFIDDCSTDSTVSIIKDYKSKTDINVRLIKNSKNVGPGLSRRQAAEQAYGEYLCFCDSDDFYNSNILKDIDKEIENSRSDLVLFDMSYVIGGKDYRKNYTAPFKYGDKLSYLSNCAESLCNLVVKRTLFLSIPPIDVRNGEDLALVPLLIVNARKITHIDKSYYNYVMRSDSASLGKVSKDAYNNMLLAFEHIHSNLNFEDNEIRDCVEFLGIKTVLYNATLMAIKGGNNNNLLSKIVMDFSQNYPTWNHNVHIKKIKLEKYLYLWLLKNKLWLLCRAFAKLHSYILTRN